MGKRKKSEWETSVMNNRTYLHYYERLMGLAVSMFEWKNLPPTINPRYLELLLFSMGKVAVFKDDEAGGLVVTKCANKGALDIYNEPKEITAYANNGYRKDITNNKDSVVIFNNVQHTGSMQDIELFARRLYEAERTIDVNVKAQKTPVAILCDENQRLTFKQLYSQYDGNTPFIFGDKNIDLNNIKALVTGAPFVATEVNVLKKEIFNEALTYLGISNVNIQKRERLITDEVQRNMGGVIAQRYVRLNPRQEACEKINRMFGTNISVEYRDTIEPIDSLIDDGKGGDGDE